MFCRLGTKNGFDSVLSLLFFFVYANINLQKRFGGLLMASYIPRKEYLDFLIRNKDRPIIKVVSGVRRCGKSTLFEIYKEHLLSIGVKQSHIISINFEDISFEHLTDYKELHRYVANRLLPDEMNYIFLDEIQHVEMFEKAVDSLYIKKNVDLYITGSNAYFMSGELATLLSGRYIEVRMLPLSFKEYCLTAPKNLSSQEKYNRYITNSSFPYVAFLGENDKDVQEYLRSLYNTILLKDVVARYKISDVMMLESVVRFVFDNVGSRLSPTNIANTMTSNGRKIDAKTVEKYLSGLVDSLIIYQAKRYNIKGKQYLKLQEKYYIVDMGLRYALLGGRNAEIGHILENVIYLELIRRGYDVYVGQIDGKEVDFVAISTTENLYIQVSATVRSKDTLDRELASLRSIDDSYPKLILTLDDDPDANYDGIKITNALKWLLE